MSKAWEFWLLSVEEVLGGMFAWKGVTTDSANGQPLKPFGITYVPGSKLPLFPYIIGDGHQPNSRGLYTHY